MRMGPIFRALGDDTRLRIMLLLQVMELSVGELALVLEQSQPRVSRHVRILVEAGLAERRKEGAWVFLRDALVRDDAEPARLLSNFMRSREAIGPDLGEQSRRDVARLEAIRAQRDERAAHYFAEQASNWDSLRSLYIPEAEIESQLQSLLGGTPLGRLLDIGTGTGRMVELFADSSERCTALDKSPEMLRLARAKLHNWPPERVELVQGDFNSLPFESASYDTVILHQVLHFAQNPGQVVGEAGRVTAADGRIAIVDFLPHAHEELRERDAHARLGFSDDQIASYLAGGGFALEARCTLPGQSLTVQIWLGRRKTTPAARPAQEKRKHAA